MDTYSPKPLPRGYGAAAIDPPEERIPFCTCGHSWEDHADDVNGQPCLMDDCKCRLFDESDGIDTEY